MHVEATFAEVVDVPDEELGVGAEFLGITGRLIREGGTLARVVRGAIRRVATVTLRGVPGTTLFLGSEGPRVRGGLEGALTRRMTGEGAGVRDPLGGGGDEIEVMLVPSAES